MMRKHNSIEFQVVCNVTVVAQLIYVVEKVNLKVLGRPEFDQGGKKS